MWAPLSSPEAVTAICGLIGTIATLAGAAWKRSGKREPITAEDKARFDGGQVAYVLQVAKEAADKADALEKRLAAVERALAVERTRTAELVAYVEYLLAIIRVHLPDLPLRPAPDGVRSASPDR